jgi:hypothetical protein
LTEYRLYNVTKFKKARNRCPKVQQRGKRNILRLYKLDHLPLSPVLCFASKYAIDVNGMLALVQAVTNQTQCLRRGHSLPLSYTTGDRQQREETAQITYVSGGGAGQQYDDGQGYGQGQGGGYGNAGEKTTAVVQVQGQYSYVAPDGTPITVRYTVLSVPEKYLRDDTCGRVRKFVTMILVFWNEH